MSKATDLEQSSPPSTANTGRRRSSIAELFNVRPNLDSSPPGPGVAKSSGSSMATALSQAQDPSRTRRLSITTLGLSGTQAPAPQQTPFGHLRRGSSAFDTPTRRSQDSDSAIDDSDPMPALSSSAGSSASPNGGGMSPSGRRFSFGARAYGEGRASMSGPSMSKPPLSGSSAAAPSNGNSPSGGTTNGSSTNKAASPPSMRNKSEGFSWTDSFRARAQRTSMSAEPPGGSLPFPSMQQNRTQNNPAAQAVPAPVPKAPPKAPDHFQERILKGDFYMD